MKVVETPEKPHIVMMNGFGMVERCVHDRRSA
jgi:hypothetical protein